MMSLVMMKVVCDRSVVIARMRKKAGAGRVHQNDEVVEFPPPNDQRVIGLLTSAGFTLQHLHVLTDIVMNSQS